MEFYPSGMYERVTDFGDDLKSKLTIAGALVVLLTVLGMMAAACYLNC